jgi:hypothetical protein
MSPLAAGGGDHIVQIAPALPYATASLQAEPIALRMEPDAADIDGRTLFDPVVGLLRRGTTSQSASRNKSQPTLLVSMGVADGTLKLCAKDATFGTQAFITAPSGRGLARRFRHAMTWRSLYPTGCAYS